MNAFAPKQLKKNKTGIITTVHVHKQHQKFAKVQNTHVSYFMKKVIGQTGDECTQASPAGIILGRNTVKAAFVIVRAKTPMYKWRFRYKVKHPFGSDVYPGLYIQSVEAAVLS